MGTVCTECGKQSIGKFCTNCGSPIDKNAGFFATLFLTIIEPIIYILVNIKNIFLFNQFIKNVKEGKLGIKKAVIVFVTYIAVLIYAMKCFGSKFPDIPLITEQASSLCAIAFFLIVSIPTHLIFRRGKNPLQFKHYFIATLFISTAVGTLQLMALPLIWYDPSKVNDLSPNDILAIKTFQYAFYGLGFIYGLRVIKGIYERKYGYIIVVPFLIGIFISVAAVILIPVGSYIVREIETKITSSNATETEVPVESGDSQS